MLGEECHGSKALKHAMPEVQMGIETKLAKLSATPVKRAGIKYLPPKAGPAKHGAVPKGGTALPVCIGNMLFARAQCRRSATIIVFDLRRPFYSVLTEIAVGS